MLEYVDPLKTFLSIRLVIGLNNTANAANYNTVNVSCLKPLANTTNTNSDFVPYLAKKHIGWVI